MLLISYSVYIRILLKPNGNILKLVWGQHADICQYTNKDTLQLYRVFQKSICANMVNKIKYRFYMFVLEKEMFKKERKLIKNIAKTIFKMPQCFLFKEDTRIFVVIPYEPTLN